MGRLKCTYLVLLVFLSAAFLCSTSDAHVRRKLEGNAAVTKTRAVSSVKGGDINAVNLSKIAVVDMMSLGGRKMAVQKAVVDGKSTVRSSNQLERNQHSETSSSEGGSVAFNEDYHAPRHHPPKNN